MEKGKFEKNTTFYTFHGAYAERIAYFLVHYAGTYLVHYFGKTHFFL